eukprot:7867056-Pyramimonas_sp.AAC.1
MCRRVDASSDAGGDGDGDGGAASGGADADRIGDDDSALASVMGSLGRNSTCASARVARESGRMVSFDADRAPHPQLALKGARMISA